MKLSCFFEISTAILLTIRGMTVLPIIGEPEKECE